MPAAARSEVQKERSENKNAERVDEPEIVDSPLDRAPEDFAFRIVPVVDGCVREVLILVLVLLQLVDQPV